MADDVFPDATHKLLIFTVLGLTSPKLGPYICVVVQSTVRCFYSWYHMTSEGLFFNHGRSWICWAFGRQFIVPSHIWDDGGGGGGGLSLQYWNHRYRALSLCWSLTSIPRGTFAVELRPQTSGSNIEGWRVRTSVDHRSLWLMYVVGESSTMLFP